MREDPLLHPDQVDGAELEALRVVDGHERDERAVAADRVLVGVERDLLEEGREGLVFRFGLLAPFARDGDELLEVLHAALRLDRPLGLERLDVAAAGEHLLDQLGHLASPCAADMSDSIVARNALSAFCGAAPTPAFSASAVASQSEISRWSAQV